MQRIANRDARNAAKCRMEFNGSNIFGRATADGERYVVFDYGLHYPMYVWDSGQWYENGDGYSITTSKHHGQVRPVPNTLLMSTEAMQQLVAYGIAGVAVNEEVSEDIVAQAIGGSI